MTLTPETTGPADELEILNGLKKQAAAIMYGPTPPSKTEWKLANITACLLEILIHEREQRRSR